jgi:putative membrane protein
MKTVFNLIVTTLMMGWVVSIAVFSIQNIQAVRIKFLVFESIKMPIGVLLAFCVGFGFIIGSLLPVGWKLLLGNKGRKRIRSNQQIY